MKIILISSFIFLFACRNSNTDTKVYVEKEVVHSSIKLSLDSSNSYEILLDSTYTPQLSYLKQLNDSIVYFDYIEIDRIWNLMSYNFENREFSKNANFQTEGPNDIDGNGNSLDDFLFLNSDSIFFMNSSGIVIANSEGKVIYKEKINYKDSVNYSLYLNHPYSTLNYYDKEIILSSKRIDKNENTPDWYETPPVKAFNIYNKKTIFFPFSFSSLYKMENTFYGTHNESTWFLDGIGNIILSFPADPNIYVYNIKKKQLSTKGAKSKYATPFEPLKADKIGDNDAYRRLTITQTLYLTILYDKFRKLYYRFVRLPLEYKRKDGKYNGIDDKITSLMVFDNDFQLIDEYKIGKKYNSPFSIIKKDGLYIFQLPVSEEKLVYSIFRFNKISK